MYADTLTDMYKVDLPVNERELKAVERRSSAEDERKIRIFNPKTRVIGVDLPALNKQVMEKRERLHMEKQRDMAYGTRTILYIKAL